MEIINSAITVAHGIFIFITIDVDIPGSVSSPGGGWADNGPGVLPLPGDRASSFIAPPYDNEELGGLC